MPEKDTLKYHPAVLKLYALKLDTPLVKEGSNYATLCPFHPDKDSKSFKILNSARNNNFWYCFGCKRGGDIYDFLKEKEGLDYTAARKVVEEWVGENATQFQKDSQQVEGAFSSVEEETKKYVVVSFESYKPFIENLRKSETAQKWLLEKRGIRLETAVRLGLGYVQDIGNLAYDKPYRDKGWIVFPYIDGDDVALIKYRSIVTKDFRRLKGMRTPLFNLPAIDAWNTLYVVEGEFDACVMEQAGFRTVSLPAGANSKNDKTILTPQMKDRIAEADKIVLAGDMDAVGSNNMYRLLNSELIDLKYTFQIDWPQGFKDANDVFLKHCKGDTQAFKNLVEESTVKARPMEKVSTLSEILLDADQTPVADDPTRLRFPWSGVDNMAIIKPGDFITLFATQTKQGKTAWTVQATLYNAMKFGARVLNYQCELSKDQFARMVAAHVLQKSRNSLEAADFRKAANELGDLPYWFGRDFSLSRVGEVLDLIEKAIKRLDPTIVVIDHLHFIVRNESDPIQAQADATQRIKQLAEKYGVIFIVVGQPRKAKGADRGKLVHITDLKGSEATASDASAIFALHRDWIKVKDPANPPKDDFTPETEIHLLAARSKGDGATMQQLYFVGETASFREVIPAQVLAA